VSRQRGLSIVSLIVLVALLGCVVVVGMRVLPTFVEYRAIQAAVKKAKAGGGTTADMVRAFDRSATIDDITTLAGKDLNYTKVDDDVVISFAYVKKIPLFGPVSLTIDYSGSSKSL
jgi:hypothetical protein